MPIFELTDKEIRAVEVTTFQKARILERQHLQRLLRSAIETVAPNTMVLAEEFGEWEGSLRRIDLLALDDSGNLVVVELKRDDDAHMELQALRYAAMVSPMTFSRAVETHQRYLNRLGIQADARAVILQHLDWIEPREEDFAQDVRVVLVSSDFSMELTSTVMWLNERDLDIRCVRVQPYQLGERLLLDVQQLIPLPEAAHYQIQLREKATEARAARSDGGGPDHTRYNLRIGNAFHSNQTKRAMMLLVAKAALEKRINRAALKLPARKWLVVDGDIRSRAAFLEKARAARGPERALDERRWFANDEDLFHDATSTFALSNQWGGSLTFDTLDRLRTEFPELGLSYEPVDDE